MGWGPHKTRILDLGSHVQSPGWPPSPDPAPGVTHPQSPGWPPSPDPAPGVTCPQSPGWPPSQDPAPGVARPLVRTPGLCWLGPYGGNEWVPVTSWLGRLEYHVRLLPPHLSQRHPPLLCLFLCDINCFYSFPNDVEHTTLVFAFQPLVVPLSCHENTADAGLEDKGQFWSLIV